MIIKLQKPIFDNKDYLAYFAVMMFALWFMIMIAAVNAPNMMKLQIGEEFPERQPIEIIIELKGEYKLDIHYTDDGTRVGTIDPSYPISGIISGLTLFLLNRLYNWWKSKKQKE